MEQTPEISIIIPIYKVEQYLSVCIESVLSQSFKNIELLLIDDGSPDHSGQICEEYAKKDKRIIVFHQKNKGVGSARNIGLDLAKGEWIFFVDSDDFLEHNCLTNFIEIIKNNEIDLIQFGFNDIGSDKTTTILPRNMPITCNSYDEYDSCNCFRGELWNYLFRNKIIIINKLRFSENLKYAEDQEFLLKYLAFTKSIVLLPIIVYNYLHREFSAMQVYLSPEMLNDNLIVVQNIFHFYSENKIIMSAMVSKRISRLIALYLASAYKTNYTKSELKIISKQYVQFYERYKNTYPGIFGSNIRFKLSYISIHLYIFIAKAKHQLLK